MALDDKDLVKAGVDAALAPVRDTVNRIAGPFADEVGGILADRVRVFRYRQALKLFQKVRAIAEETGIELRTVPLKTLLPILENASLEDDEDLHDRWANLLANAAGQKGLNRPAFPSILRELTSEDAKFFDHLCPPQGETAVRSFHEASYLEYIYSRVNPSEDREDRHERYETCLASLIRLGLIERRRSVKLDEFRHRVMRGPLKSGESDFSRMSISDLQKAVDYTDQYIITALGFEFVAACRRPEAADEAKA